MSYAVIDIDIYTCFYAYESLEFFKKFLSISIILFANDPYWHWLFESMLVLLCYLFSLSHIIQSLTLLSQNNLSEFFVLIYFCLYLHALWIWLVRGPFYYWVAR